MDGHSIAILEYDRILERTASSARLEENRETLRNPVFPDRDGLRFLFDRTDELLTLIGASGRPPIPPLPPLSPVLEMCRAEGAVLSAHDLRTAALWGKAGGDTAAYLDNPESGGLARFAAACRVGQSFPDEVLNAISPEGIINDEAYPELRAIRRDIRREQDALDRELSGILHNPDNASLFRDRLVTIRDGRYVLPLKSGKKGRLDGIIHSRSSTGETLFIEPMAAVERNNRISGLEADEQECIHRILRDLTAALHSERTAYLALHEALLSLDGIAARAGLALSLTGTRPKIADRLDLKSARHPLLEVTPVPVNIRPGEKRMMVITGPNTGGKTVGLKTAGLLTMMALGGFFIPAEEGSTVPDVRNILCDIGDEQSISGNLSTFSAHIGRIRELLSAADSTTMILIDEPGAGTDPQEGAALARAILEKLLKSGAWVMTSTHYHELKHFAYTEQAIVSASVAFDPETFTPGYTIETGQPGPSRALEIARNLGLDRNVVDRAEELLGPESRRLEGVLQALQNELETVREERAAAGALRKEQEELTHALREKMAGIEREKAEMMAEAREEIDTKVREYAEGMDRIIRELRESGKRPDARQESELKRASRELGETVRQEAAQVKNEAARTVEGPIMVGDPVRVRGTELEGEVTALLSRGKKASVRTGSTTTTVETDRLIKLERKSRTGRKKAKATVRLNDGVPAVSPSLDLRGKRYEEAEEILRTYLDSASLARIGRVTIIHGKGTGALQQATREVLKGHPLVSGYEYSSLETGGTGSTTVTLR